MEEGSAGNSKINFFSGEGRPQGHLKAIKNDVVKEIGAPEHHKGCETVLQGITGRSIMQTEALQGRKRDVVSP